MSNQPKAQSIYLTDDLATTLFEQMIVLNNDLASLSPKHIVPVQGFEEEFGRERAAAALGAILNFLRAVGVPGESREPLFELYFALGDAKHGRRNTMFKPGAPLPDSALKQSLPLQDDSMAAAAVSILHTHCDVTVDKALTVIAEAFGYQKEVLREVRKNITTARGSKPTKKGAKKAPKQAIDAYEYWEGERKRQLELRGLSAAEFVQDLIETRGFKAKQRR